MANIRWAATVTALKAETGMANGDAAILAGYHAVGDGGGGTVWFSTLIPTSRKISGASGNPIEITTQSPHGLFSGQRVMIDGVGGNTAANGTWPITTGADASKFTIPPNSNAGYTSGTGAIGDGGFIFPSSSQTNPPLGIWTRTVDTEDHVNVKWFGAKGDNTADDTLAIQASVDAIVLDGRTIYFPKGVYKITSQLRIANHATALRGAGRETSVLKFLPTTDPATLLLFERSGGQLIYCGIKDLSMSASGDETRVKVAVDLHDVRYSVFDNVAIKAWNGGTGSIGFRVRGRDNNHFTRLRVEADYPIVIDLNDDGGSGYLDTKDLDHVQFDACALVPDNPRRAAIWFKPGVVYRQISIGPYMALVGGGVVCVDKDDADDDTIDSVNAGTDELTLNTHLYSTGDSVQLIGGDLPAPLVEKTWYFVIKTGTNTLKLAASRADAFAGTQIPLSDAGSGSQTVTGALFLGADEVPRRVSNHLELRGVRVEGGVFASGGVGENMLIGDPNAWAIDIRRHKNGKLRELKLENCLLGEQRDARRSLLSGEGGAANGSPWSALRCKGVERLEIDAATRYGGVGTVLDSDPDTILGVSPQAELVAGDAGRLFPESETQWSFLKVKVPQHFWNFDKTTNGDPEDLQTSSPDDRPLFSGVAPNAPEGQHLKDGYRGYWSKFTAISNQKFRLNYNGSDVNPDAHAVAVSGFVWPDTGWNPSGGEVICNISGTSTGPLLRVRSDKKIEINCNSINSPSQMSYWDDDQPFWYRLFHDPAQSILRCLVVKADGRREVIVGTFASSVGNDVNKGFGSYTSGVNSPKMWQMYGTWELDDVARQDQVAMAEAVRMLRRTGRATLSDVEGLQLTRTSNSAVSVAAGRIRSDDDTADIVLDSPVSIDLASGGLDTGSEAASTTYHVWIFADSRGTNAPTGRFSTNAMQPTVPTGYDLKRRVGACSNNSSSNLLQFRQVGDGRNRTIFWEEVVTSVLNVLSAGAATGFTDVNLNPSSTKLVPSTSRNVHLLAGFNANNAANKLTLRPDGSAVGDGPWEIGAGGTTVTPGHRVQIEMPCSAAQIIEYQVSNANDRANIWVLGYDDRI